MATISPNERADAINGPSLVADYTCETCGDCAAICGCTPSRGYHEHAARCDHVMSICESIRRGCSLDLGRIPAHDLDSIAESLEHASVEEWNDLCAKERIAPTDERVRAMVVEWFRAAAERLRRIA